MDNSAERILAYHNLLNLLKSDNSMSKEESKDDKTFRNSTTKQLSDRDEKYTELLAHFVQITKVRNVLKEIFKWMFYIVIMGAMVALTIIVVMVFYKIIREAEISEVMEAIPLLITSLVGFVSTIIVIPATITKYLFSTKEDENITQIILHTQEHDTCGRKWAMDFKKLVDSLEKKDKR